MPFGPIGPEHHPLPTKKKALTFYIPSVDGQDLNKYICYDSFINAVGAHWLWVPPVNKTKEALTFYIPICGRAGPCKKRCALPVWRITFTSRALCGNTHTHTHTHTHMHTNSHTHRNTQEHKRQCHTWENECRDNKSQKPYENPDWTLIDWLTDWLTGHWMFRNVGSASPLDEVHVGRQTPCGPRCAESAHRVPQPTGIYIPPQSWVIWRCTFAICTLKDTTRVYVYGYIYI